MKVALICHEDDPLNRHGLLRWLGSEFELVGVVSIQESRQTKKKRFLRQLRKLGIFRFLDVVVYRIYHRIRWGRADLRYQSQTLRALAARYPRDLSGVPVFHTSSANSASTRDFLVAQAPDLVIARCKSILKPEIFEIPPLGTWVMHPGICPEYRNSHGCFWAMAMGEPQNLGMTLLRVDRGVDTGPVYGYFRVRWNVGKESHWVVQYRTVFDHLDAISTRIREIGDGTARALDTTGRRSGIWGQPWMSAYLKIQRNRLTSETS